MEQQELACVLHFALAPILTNQPDNPLLHLMSHVREKAGLSGSTPVSSAYRVLQLCPASIQHCEGNIMEAFTTLGAANNGHVAAQQFLQLVNLLVESLPQELQQPLVVLFEQLTQLSPDYATFRAAAKSCMLLDQLSTASTERSPSDQMFQEAEARKLLVQLLRAQHWLAALQPRSELRAGDLTLTWDSSASATAINQQQEECAQHEAGRLVALAVAAAQSDSGK